MIPEEVRAEIRRLYHVEKWRVGTIAAQLHLHHTTVKRVLALRVPPQKRRDMLLGLLYNREHESENQCQRDALYP